MALNNGHLAVAAAFSADALLNAGTALFVGLFATGCAVVLAVYQRHQDKSAQLAIAAERKRADDAAARLELARAEEIARLIDENRELREHPKRSPNDDV